MKISNLHDWKKPIDLSPCKKKIRDAAEKREKQKIGYKTSRQWSKQATNLTGLKGEFAFSLCTGLPVDMELNKHGDFGADFLFEGIAYDIKTTTHTGDEPALLEMLDKKLVAHVYVLVQVDEWEAKIVGWATRKQMRHSQKRDFGRGERFSVTKSEIKEMGQDTIPPLVPSISTDPRIAAQKSVAQLANTGMIIRLPEKDRVRQISTDRKHCFPHGPFDRIESKTSVFTALHCQKCGRFYGYERSVAGLID